MNVGVFKKDYNKCAPKHQEGGVHPFNLSCPVPGDCPELLIQNVHERTFFYVLSFEPAILSRRCQRGYWSCYVTGTM